MTKVAHVSESNHRLPLLLQMMYNRRYIPSSFAESKSLFTSIPYPFNRVLMWPWVMIMLEKVRSLATEELPLFPIFQRVHFVISPGTWAFIRNMSRVSRCKNNISMVCSGYFLSPVHIIMSRPWREGPKSRGGLLPVLPSTCSNAHSCRRNARINKVIVLNFKKRTKFVAAYEGKRSKSTNLGGPHSGPILCHDPSWNHIFSDTWTWYHPVGLWVAVDEAEKGNYRQGYYVDSDAYLKTLKLEHRCSHQFSCFLGGFLTTVLILLWLFRFHVLCWMPFSSEIGTSCSRRGYILLHYPYYSPGQNSRKKRDVYIIVKDELVKSSGPLILICYHIHVFLDKLSMCHQHRIFWLTLNRFFPAVLARQDNVELILLTHRP